MRITTILLSLSLCVLGSAAYASSSFYLPVPADGSVGRHGGSLSIPLADHMYQGGKNSPFKIGSQLVCQLENPSRKETVIAGIDVPSLCKGGGSNCYKQQSLNGKPTTRLLHLKPGYSTYVMNNIFPHEKTAATFTNYDFDITYKVVSCKVTPQG